MKKTKMPQTTLVPGLAKILKRLHYPLEVILLCVRWYVDNSLSSRNLEEMMMRASGRSSITIRRRCRSDTPWREGR
ncbi:transposase-like protein [Paraburkholderia sp. UCT70]